jgi:cation transport protein ChaC
VPSLTSSTSAGIVAETTTSIKFAERTPIKCLVYIGLPSNPQFLGPQEPGALAKKILESCGPSGENKEYLFNLERSLRGLGRESGDAHVSELVRRCKELEGDVEVEEQVGNEDGEMEEVEK